MTYISKGPLGQKHKNGVSEKIRAASRDRGCTLAIPGVCCYDASRTVGCHLRMFGHAGMSEKPDDVLMVDACDKCHYVLDHRDLWSDSQLGWDDVLRALMETLMRRRRDGLIILKGEKT